MLYYVSVPLLCFVCVVVVKRVCVFIISSRWDVGISCAIELAPLMLPKPTPKTHALTKSSAHIIIILTMKKKACVIRTAHCVLSSITLVRNLLHVIIIAQVKVAVHSHETFTKIL